MQMDKTRPSTVVDVIKSRAEEDPKKNGYVFIGKSRELLPLTRWQLWDLSGRFASRLRRYGIKIGDVVSNSLANSRSRLITDFGILLAGGATLTNEAVLLDGRDFLGSIKSSNCQTVIIASDDPALKFLGQYISGDASDCQQGCEAVYPIKCDQAPCLRQAIVLRVTSHEEHTAFLASLEDEDFYTAPVTAEDEAYIFRTSGTTGFSKLIPRTHREILDLSVDNAEDILDQDDIIYSDRALGWVVGYPHLYFSAGVTIHSQEQLAVRRGVADVWDYMTELGMTLALMNPEDILLVKEGLENGRFKMRMLRNLVTFGQPIRKVILQLVGHMTERVTILYGSTEMGFVSTGVIGPNNKDVVKDGFIGDRWKRGIEIKIVSEVTGKLITEPFEQGKMYVRGGSLMRKYLNAEKSTLNAITEDGWFDTSDLGYMDEKGDFYVTGRTSDSIMCGTQVVYPGWIEERVQFCPGVSSVYAVGTPNPTMTEDVCICVVPKDGSNLTERLLESFVDAMFASGTANFHRRFFITESFPLNNTGKVSRTALRKKACDRFGITTAVN